MCIRDSVSSVLVSILKICIDVNTIGSFALDFHIALIECCLLYTSTSFVAVPAGNFQTVGNHAPLTLKGHLFLRQPTYR